MYNYQPGNAAQGYGAPRTRDGSSSQQKNQARGLLPNIGQGYADPAKTFPTALDDPILIQPCPGTLTSADFCIARQPNWAVESSRAGQYSGGMDMMSLKPKPWRV